MDGRRAPPSNGAVAIPPTSGSGGSSQGEVTPRVIGLSVSDAGAVLIAAGFRSPVSWRADPAAAGVPCSVVRQDPAAGAAFEPGAPATLVIVRGSCR